MQIFVLEYMYGVPDLAYLMPRVTPGSRFKKRNSELFTPGQLAMQIASLVGGAPMASDLL